MIAGGPSVSAAQVEALRGRARVVAVNDAYRLAPWADVCYFADFRWWDWHRDRDEFKRFAGQKASIEPSISSITDPDVLFLRNGTHRNMKSALSEAPDMLISGGNSAFQAFNLCTLAAPATVLLLGVDLRFGEKGEHHWFGRHPDNSNPQGIFESAKRAFAAAAPVAKRLGVRVVNCSARSALECFERASVEEALQGARV